MSEAVFDFSLNLPSHIQTRANTSLKMSSPTTCDDQTEAAFDSRTTLRRTSCALGIFDQMLWLTLRQCLSRTEELDVIRSASL